MADPSHGVASFWTQVDALLRKNLTFQKRNMKTNVRLVMFPILICVLIFASQTVIDKELGRPKNKCECICTDKNGDGQCDRVCGIDFSIFEGRTRCSFPRPPEWPPMLQMPGEQVRAVRTDDSFTDLPNESCKEDGSCPVTVLLTGNNQSLGEILGENLFTRSSAVNKSEVLANLVDNVLGTMEIPEDSNFLEPAFFWSSPIYNVQSQCPPNSTVEFDPFWEFPVSYFEGINVFRCVQGLHLWRNSSSEVNEELYKGYLNGNSENKINEILAAYDFLNTKQNNFNVTIWYNSSYRTNEGAGSTALVRVPRLVNLVSNAYLKFLQGPSTKIAFEFVKEMPKPEIPPKRLDVSSLVGTLFFTWTILQLFPVVLALLVYEKQQRLRIMMKMHGLGDGPYWMISYAYFLSISLMYILCLVIFGSVIGLKFFTMNDYSIQFLFYFVYINLQISVAFLVAAMFSNVKTVTVIAYICIFGTGFLGTLFQFFLEDGSFPRFWIVVMELYPGFSLYRGLYEFAQIKNNTIGIRWGDLSDSMNGMREVLIIMLVEWLVVLFFAYYIDQIISIGSGKCPIFFLQNHRKKPSFQREERNVLVQMEKPDVSQEREKVDQLLLEPCTSHSIICDNLKKVFPGMDGNPEKFAVRGLSLALPQGECFGMLGPNGAGKTSFISMMIGLTKPTSGTAFVQGLDIRNHMNKIYTSMGVCPQDNLLWETLTGREHLLFYGRLKNLKGSALTQAVEDSLRSVNLFDGGVADKKAGKYSGGMKRRLSVAISLIGDPKVVYMDEPGTGLDPASRYNLWNVVKRAKQDRAIILTTHSMEEAEVLCDRLGIFVDGSLQCIGNPKQLKARYGGSYVFTMTTSSNHEEDVENLVQHLSPNANKIYQISGTQKFELLKHEVRIADVFRAVEKAKSRFTVSAWGIADTTLEDVFIKVAREAQAPDRLS